MLVSEQGQQSSSSGLTLPQQQNQQAGTQTQSASSLDQPQNGLVQYQPSGNNPGPPTTDTLGQYQPAGNNETPLAGDDLAYTKNSANSGVDQGCPLSACGFSAVVDPVLRSVMAQLCTHYDSGAELFAYLDDWYLWIKPKYLLQTVASIITATGSVDLALQSTKTQVWKGSCQDPIPPEFQNKVTLTLSCLGGHLQIHGDTEPSPVVLGEQTTMEKTTQRFQKIATTQADLDAEGLNVQTVNELLTMYVGAASQHVLRMSFVPEQEAHNFDRQVMTFWSHLMHRDIILRCFFYLSSLVDLGWDLQFNATRPPHGGRGSRSFPR